jgi:concanavalin A-like lectin/glucanase superfamily protein
VFANTGFISFVQQPTQAAAGAAITPAVKVQLIDASGAVVPGVLVTVAIGNNTGGGTLSGTTTVLSDQVGIATFSNLSIDVPGAGYTLVASAKGAGGAASNAFSISLPAPPTALTAVLAPPGSVTLNWNSSVSQVGGYNVYRSTVSGGPYTKLSTVNSLTFTDGTVAAGQTYFYVVTALSLNNIESVFSNEALAIIPSGSVIFFGQTIDPLGDALGGGTNPDLVWGGVSVFNNGAVRLSARYASGTFNSSNTQAFFLLDTDQNVNTGSLGSDPVCSAPDNTLIGVDYVVLMQAGLGLNPVANQATIFKATGGCNQFAQVGTATVAILPDGMDVTFPLSLLNNTPGPGVSGPATTGPWNLKVLAQFAIPGVGLSGITDTMPNAGVAPASTAASPLPITPPSGMLAWWPADGYPSDIQTGHGMLISSGVSFAPGEVGQSFAFDGLTGFITITDNGDLRPSSVTVDFWFKSNINLPDTNHPEVPLLFKLNPGDDANIASKGYDFFYQFGGLGFGLPSTPSGLRTIVPFSTAIAAGTWHHVAGTYDSTGQKLYFDGSLVASGPNFGPIQYQPAALQFGTVFNTADFSPSVNSPNRTYFFNGQLDEIEIHNRALSASEIQAIFNAGSVGKLKP